MKGRREKKKAKEGNGTEKTIMICSFRKKCSATQLQKTCCYIEKKTPSWEFCL